MEDSLTIILLNKRKELIGDLNESVTFDVKKKTVFGLHKLNKEYVKLILGNVYSKRSVLKTIDMLSDQFDYTDYTTHNTRITGLVYFINMMEPKMKYMYGKNETGEYAKNLLIRPPIIQTIDYEG